MGRKKLEDMTLEELWQLFPIHLTEHQNHWREQFEKEKSKTENLLSNLPFKRISHIGSTAIDSIWAKPIVDILIEIPMGSSLVEYAHIFEKNGYRKMSQEMKRISLNKGYTEEGFAEEVFHLHLRYVGDHDELYFRDYLLKYPEIAKEYEQLKLSLWKRFEYNRDGYTEGKTDFIRKYTDLAKKELGKKY